MIDLGPHAVFIVFGYLGALAGALALIGGVWLRLRAVTARLAALEAQGARRRSGGPAV